MDGMSVPRSYHVMVSSGGSVYAIGGATTGMGQPPISFGRFFHLLLSKQECLKTLPVVFEFEDCDFVHGGTIFWIFLSVHMIHIP